MHRPRLHPDLPSNATTTVVQTLYEQGSQVADSGDYMTALACFDRAIAVDPTYAPAWVFRGVVLLHLEQYDAALQSCEQAIALDPSDAEAWTFRGVALQRLGQYRHAYNSYDQALGRQRHSWQQRCSLVWHWGRQWLFQIQRLFYQLRR